MFSKMLATIKRDVPIDFSIAERKWKKSVSEKSVEDLFAELEFRSLIAQVKKVIGVFGRLEK